MGKKILDLKIEQWLNKGNVQQLDEHWDHPMVKAYRQKQIESTMFYRDTRNAWFDGVRNGATFSFLMGRDETFNTAHKTIGTPSSWFEQFEKVYESSWDLLDIAPRKLQNANALYTLEILMREGNADLPEYAPVEIIRMVYAKLNNEMHGFYRRFQKHEGLTAIAWMDNEGVWYQKQPCMPAIMRHAASHHPNDVLGAYLVWGCDAGCKSSVHAEHDKTRNVDRMKQLRLLAERVGLNTNSYDEHVHRCKTLYEGLGMELNGTNVLAYVQGTTMTAAPLTQSEEFGSLFV